MLNKKKLTSTSISQSDKLVDTVDHFQNEFRTAGCDVTAVELEGLWGEAHARQVSVQQRARLDTVRPAQGLFLVFFAEVRELT